MEIFNHTFVNAHIIGCSPVKKIGVFDKGPIGGDKHYYQLDLYTTGGLHQFKSEIFNYCNEGQCSDEQKNSHNIKVNIWKEAADRYINFIESLNPSDYNNDMPGL